MHLSLFHLLGWQQEAETCSPLQLLSPGAQGASAPTSIVPNTSNGETGPASPTPASAASPYTAVARSKASLWSNTATTANPFREKNHHAPKQPLAIHLYFGPSLGCHRKGSGRFLPARAEFVILLSLVSVTVWGGLEGGSHCGPCSPLLCGCCASYWEPSEGSFTRRKGVVQNIVGLHRPEL